MPEGYHIYRKHVHRVAVLFSLVLAGEIIFSLPFHVARFFRPTFLSVFELSNTALGDVFAVFGLTAALVYFPGGVLADFVSARKLMSISLIATALGGIYMAQIPNQTGLGVLFAYWGMTSIFLFWAAMIKATREWGGPTKQGSAFGLLDGGRGLIAALLASIAVFLLSTILPSNFDTITDAERRDGLQNVIYFYSCMTGLSAMVIWVLVPDSQVDNSKRMFRPFGDIIVLLANKNIWLQAAIVVCAYCAYKGLDNFALYAVDALGMNEIEAARFTSQAAYLRPISAICAGFLANRIKPSVVIALAFALLLVSCFVLSRSMPSATASFIIYFNIVITFCAVYALRGVYFALMEESSIEKSRTGSAVGVVSLVGFTPDIFFAPLAGRILDASPGIGGHQNFFLLLVFTSVSGLLAALVLKYRTKNKIDYPQSE